MARKKQEWDAISHEDFLVWKGERKNTELAKRLGVKANSFTPWVQGKRAPSLELQNRIKEELGQSSGGGRRTKKKTRKKAGGRVGGLASNDVDTAGTGQFDPAAARAAMSDDYSVRVKITGIVPMIFHRFDCDAYLDAQNSPKGSKERKSDNLQSYVYRDNDNYLCVPGENICAMMATAAKRVKDPGNTRASGEKLFKSHCHVEEWLPRIKTEKGKYTKDWDFDHRCQASVQRNRVVRVRPAMNPGWSLEFTFQITASEWIDKALLYEVLYRAGKGVGLCDHRPRFGRFRVEKFEGVKLHKN